MSKHTPTPWYAERPFQEPGLYITSKVNTALIAKMSIHYDGELDESEADAAFIVRAVNAHEDLVALVTEMYDEAKNVRFIDRHDWKNRCSAALATAHGAGSEDD